MPKLNPPFRADQVGSLLRPKELLEKRYEWKKGEYDKILSGEVKSEPL
jgi:methionine synthase II (cobalamin-independent)